MDIDMKAKKSFALLLALIMCLTLFASCGKDGDSDSSPSASTVPSQSDNTPGASSPGSPAPPSNSETAPGPEVVYYAVTTFSDPWWDPALFMGIMNADLAGMIYENLVFLEMDGSVTPQLAESWDISADGLTYTFHLRKGVMWHKGYGEFTSADVKFSLERHLDPDVGSVNADNLAMSNVASIECPDDYTVVVTLLNRDVDLLNRYAMFYGMIVCKAHHDKDGADSLNTDPIGTGQFIFDGGTLGIKTEGVRNREWWGEFTGNIDRVISTYINDTNTIYAAFDNGELDAIGLYDRDKVAEYAAKGYPVTMNPVLQLLYIGVNMQLEPFDDIKVREAFFYAIDVDYYIENLFYGMESPVGSYVPPTCKYALRDYYKHEYNPDKAKELLAEAGYANGCPFTMWSVNDALGQPPAILAQDQLSRAGFIVDMQNVEFGVYIDKVRNGAAPMWVLYNDTSPLGDAMIIRYKSDFYPGNNWSGVIDDEYDSYVNAAMNATTEQEKYDNYHAAQRRMMDLRVVFPVATNSMGRVSQTNVSGFERYADMGFRLATVVKTP